MSARQWKPGEIALVRNEHNVWNVAICTLRASHPIGWWWRYGVADSWMPVADDVDARPLMVIDPESDDLIAQLASELRQRGIGQMLMDRDAARSGTTVDATFRANVADALRSLIESPKLEEPDTWGVVEASCVHTPERRREWMRHKDGNWYVVGTDTKNNPDDWDSLIDPVVIREGVAP